MSRTSKADRNWLSISANTYQLYAGTDKVQSLDGFPSFSVFGTDDTSIPWDTFLKVCDGTVAVTMVGVFVKQGQENSVDLNNGVAGCHFAGDFGWGGGQGDQVITVKGGCHDITFGGVIYSKGRNADIAVDAWSDQSRALCANLDFSMLTRVDGQPVTIILGRFGSKVAAYPVSYRVLFWKSLGYRLYWLGKWAAVKLGLVKGIK